MISFLFVHFRLLFGILFILFSLFSFGKSSEAGEKAVRFSRKSLPKENKRLTAVIIDADTGEIIYEENAHAPRCPASSIKILTIYLVFSELERGRLRLTDQLKISQHAASQKPCKLWLKAGGTISARDALLGMLTKSANDASAVLAEAISGSEKEFTRLMNRTARKLGLKKTTAINASGWPDDARGFLDRKQLSTAAELAKLSRRIIKDFPQYYKYFSTQKFTYRGTSYRNHNSLLWKKKGVDGLKTGYGGGAVGFNLAASEKRGNKRLIAVVMGARTPLERNQKISALLDKGFELLATKSKKLVKKEGLSREKAQGLPMEEALDLEGFQEIFEEHPSVSPVPSLSDDAFSPEFERKLSSLLEEETAFPSQKIQLPPKKNLKKASAPSEPKISRSSASLPKNLPFGKTKNLPSPQEISDMEQARLVHFSSSSSPLSSGSLKKWSIQIGALSTPLQAKSEGKQLLKDFPEILQSKTLKVLKIDSKKGKKKFPVRFIGFTKKQAQKACSVLKAQKKACNVIAPSL